jgi:hypothetical protein
MPDEGSLRFKPWIGDRFGEPLAGLSRILCLGVAHVGFPSDDHSENTIYVVSHYCRSDDEIPFYDQIARCLFGPDVNPLEAFEHIAFANLIQRVMRIPGAQGVSWEKRAEDYEAARVERPTARDWQGSAAAIGRYVDEVQPAGIVLFTPLALPYLHASTRLASIPSEPAGSYWLCAGREPQSLPMVAVDATEPTSDCAELVVWLRAVNERHAP